MWKLEKENNVPIYISIIELIIHNIRSGKLLPGERLPAERKLAEYFSVNRSTVVHALEELVVLGWITRKRGSGTVVNEGNWNESFNVKTDWRRYLEKNMFSKNHPLIKKIDDELIKNNKNIIDLYTGELPLDLIPSFSFPSMTWNDFLSEEQNDDLGYLPLREMLSKEFEREHRIQLASDNFLITSGGQQALFLVLQVLLKSGDHIAVEQPSFFYALPIVQAAGIHLHGIELDDEGICVEHLEKIIRKKTIKMILVNPSFQNPTGKVMSVKRRKELVLLGRKYQIPILEDDVFEKLLFDQQSPLPPLKKLDSSNVLYIGSLSKILGSTTKIGWLIAPTAVTQQLADARKMMDFSLSIFPQVLASKALLDPNFLDKIKQVKRAVQQRGKVVYHIISQINEWDVELPRGGFYLWITWKKGLLTAQAWEIFLSEGLLVMPSDVFGGDQKSIRINFSRLSLEKMSLFQMKLERITKKLMNL